MICKGVVRRACLPLIVLTSGLMAISCARDSGIREPAYVVPEKLKLRSSVAQAARAVGELKSGDPVTIVDREEAEDGAPWVKVRGPEGEIGWADARSFVREEIVAESRKIAERTREIQTQAVGKSKATLKLRLTPDRSGEENVATTLPSGTLMDIVGRERKPKPAASTPAADAEPEAAAGGEVKYDDWYLVRLRDYAVLPAGWIYGGSVALEIPAEIVYFVSTGRRISGWLKIASSHGEDGKSGDHYLVLERKIFGADDHLDFDKVKVLVYDPATRDYTTQFREDVPGRFPVKLAMQGSTGDFQLNVVDKNKEVRSQSYNIQLLDSSHIKVTRAAR